MENDTPKNELVLGADHAGYIDKNLALIQKTFELKKEELELFAIQCKRTGLDPVTRQIYALVNNEKMTIMASIDGLRLIADRSGMYEGQTKPEWCDENGTWSDVWLKKTPPTAARIGVFKSKFREALYAVALFDEYAGRYAYDVVHKFDDRYNNAFKKGDVKHKKDDLTYMWAKMPALMIAKVAEALALRKAFPNEMSGIYATEEITNTPDEPKERDASPGRQSEDPPSPAEYFPTFGKFKGIQLQDLQVHEIEGYVKWLEDGIKGGAKETEAASAFIKNAKLYLASKKDKID